MELVEIKDNQVQVAPEFLNGYKEYLKQKQYWERQEAQLKESLVGAMEEHGINEIDTEIMKIKYVAPSVRKSVDTEAMKEQGIYEDFLKESPVKASVRITVK